MQELFLRNVTKEDAKLLLEWRNESSVRENSFNSEIIAYDDHLKWISGKLEDSNEIMQILMRGKTPIGQIRLSKEDKNVEISYSVDKDWRGCGYGREIIRLGESILKDQGYNGNLVGLVKKENKASQKVFLSLGYEEREKENFFEYTKKIGRMIYIRVDMNNVIATGHMMRCLSVADAALDMGIETTFIVADEQALPLLEQRGYTAIVLNTKWDDMNSELPVLKKVVEDNNIETLLIDSYKVTENYLSELTAMVKTVYIDDLDAFVYPVTGLVCYANYWEKFGYKDKYQDTHLFLGPSYAPLRRVYKDCGAKHISEEIKNLLLVSGGNDPYGILDRMLESLDKDRYESIDVICGAYYTGDDDLRKKYREYKNVNILKAVPDMEVYIKKADLAVTAGGTTLYELCAAGTPSLSYSFADNQLDNVRQFQKDEIIDYCGDVRYDEVIEKMKVLLEQYQNPDLREERSKKMQTLIDGEGAWRIVDAIHHQIAENNRS